MKLATVYERKGRLIVQPSSKTTAGIWILQEPVLSTSADADAGEVGALVRQALESSQADVPHPTRWAGLVQPLLKAAGVRSYKTFVNGARGIDVYQEGETISFTPFRNLGHKEGFEPISEKELESKSPGAAEIGRLVRQCLVTAE